jgi:hypothetical protein
MVTRAAEIDRSQCSLFVRETSFSRRSGAPYDAEPGVNMGHLGIHLHAGCFALPRRVVEVQELEIPMTATVDASRSWTGGEHRTRYPGRPGLNCALRPTGRFRRIRGRLLGGA